MNRSMDFTNSVRCRKGGILLAMIGMAFGWAVPPVASATEEDSIVPLPRPDNAALPMRIEWEETFIDGYRNIEIRVTSENFVLLAYPSSSWNWNVPERAAVVVQHRARSDFRFEIQVFPLTAYSGNPRTPEAMAGYIEWIRRDWEISENRRFVLLENSLSTDELLAESAPAESSYPLLWGHGFERIRYALIAADGAGGERSVHHTEWWIEAEFLRARIHFASREEVHDSHREIVEAYLREMRLFPIMTPEIEAELDRFLDKVAH